MEETRCEWQMGGTRCAAEKPEPDGSARTDCGRVGAAEPMRTRPGIADGKIQEAGRCVVHDSPVTFPSQHCFEWWQADTAAEPECEITSAPEDPDQNGRDDEPVVNRTLADAAGRRPEIVTDRGAENGSTGDPR